MYQMYLCDEGKGQYNYQLCAAARTQAGVSTGCLPNSGHNWQYLAPQPASKRSRSPANRQDIKNIL